MTVNRKYLRFLVRLKKYFDLTSDTDKENTIKTITGGIELRGSNIWYLICSALLASIGLDVNSPAIVIGAMLISPLMYPILGIGISFGIHDRSTIIRSIREFLISVAIALAASVLYFWLSPLSSATTEILARTKPTLLDVGVAFFGGMAGIVAISRSRLASAIPGVAIATAIMPPICTAGFGLAHINMQIFLGALYLFFINAVFISLSSYLIVKLLKFPLKEYPNPALERKMRRIVAVIIIILIVPSILIFVDIIKEVRLNTRINKFINSNIASNDRNVIKWTMVHASGDSLVIKVFVVGEKISDNRIDSLNMLLPEKRIYSSRLNILQVEASKENNLNPIDPIALEISEINKKLDTKLKALDSLQKIVNRYKTDSLQYAEAGNEIKLLFPGITEIKLDNNVDSIKTTDTLRVKKNIILYLSWNGKVNYKIRKNDMNRISEFIIKKFNADSVIFKVIR